VTTRLPRLIQNSSRHCPRVLRRIIMLGRKIASEPAAVLLLLSLIVLPLMLPVAVSVVYCSGLCFLLHLGFIDIG